MTLKHYEEIVTSFVSPTLVLAGPGAGKTYLLADRIKRLLDIGTDKNTITVLTFGTDARQHMVEELTNTNGDFKLKFDDLPHISTMHSLGLKIVHEKPREVNLRKINLEVQSNDNIKRLLYRDAAFILGFKEDQAKEALICKQYGDCEVNSKEIKCIICKKYWDIMSKCNFIDFDDQILFACQILENNTNILQKYQLEAQHLLVDEYQDINAAQFKLIDLLSRKSRNGLFVVGDDAQSIYGFRGADPKFILRFRDDFPNAEIPPLAHSRRCHEKIMNDAVKVLKKYYPEWTGEQELQFHVPCGEEPQIWQLPSETTEAEMVAKIARYFITEKKRVLILVPKKEFFPLIVRELSKRGISHDCGESFLPERVQIAKLFIDWVNQSSNSFKTRLVVEELINKGIAHIPGAKKDRRCSEETIKNRILEEITIAKLWESVDKTNDLFAVIQNFNDSNKTIQKIRDGLLSLLNYYKDFTRDNRGLFAKQLCVVSGIWCDPSELADDICSVVKLVETQLAGGAGYVQLKTMRKAKGLEAHVVIIVGLEDDIVPSSQNALVEEARLFYVSMTRTREKLFLLHSYKRPRNVSYGIDLTNKTRSRFLDVISKKSKWIKLN